MPTDEPSAPDQKRFAEAIAAFDLVNAGDPRHETVHGQTEPVELLYARRLTDWIDRLAPTASVELRLAARALHLRRWSSPRGDYPKHRNGYHEWRDALREQHATEAGEILARVGYPEQTVARVQELILRTAYPDDPESRVLEDAATLLFLEHQLGPLAAKTEHDTVIRLLRRAWRKLSCRGRAVALCLDLSDDEAALVGEALGR